MSHVDNTGSPPWRYQASWAFGLLAIVIATCLTIVALARNQTLDLWAAKKATEFAEKRQTLFTYTGSFIDFEERLMLDELPNADYARGGVYFFGTSNMIWAFTTWDLPTEQRRVIGNYGIGASTHRTNLRLIRYLIEQRGFLAPGTSNEVILGVSYHLGQEETPASYFFALLRRHGLYTITPDDRVAPTPMSALERWLRTEKARSGGFIWNLGRLANSWVAVTTGRTRPVVHNAAAYQQTWREFMGPRWEKNIDAEVNELRETIALLRSHGAEVKVMLLPQGTWMDDLPFPARYDSKVKALCQETSTPLIDFSRALADGDFVDSNHLTVAGQEKFRKLIFDNIKDRLPK